MIPTTGESPIFEQLRESFARAAEACPKQLLEASYCFAGHHVRMRVVGDTLARHYHLPFAHLATGERLGTCAGLTIDLVDARARAIALLLRDPDLARRLGQDARRRVGAEFGWKLHVAAYEEIMARLARGAEAGEE